MIILCHRQLLRSGLGPKDDDDDKDDDGDGFSDLAAAPDDELLLLTYDLECKFVLPFNTNSLQSAFVTLEVSVDTLVDDRGIEAVLLFSLFSAFPIFWELDALPLSMIFMKNPFTLSPIFLLDVWNGCVVSRTSCTLTLSLLLCDSWR